MNINLMIENIYGEMISIRRHLHQHPELSNKEFKTQAFIMNFLDNCDIQNESCAKTGVLGLIKGQPGPTIALRADIDALPIEEITNVDFKSSNPGVMHACGHDVHTAILLGTAKILSTLPLKGTVKLLFQPAEETTGGALPMIEAGVLTNPTVDCIFGLHVMPYLETGKIEIKHNQLNAASNGIHITIKGKNGHGAYPESGVDAVLVASHIVTALQSIISRNTSPLDSCVISIGSMHGGNKSNIICDEMVLKGTMRTFNSKTRAYTKERIKTLTTTLADSFGASCCVEFSEGYEPLINDNPLVDYIEEIAKETIGEDHIEWKATPSMGVEDFSYFSNRVPGAFYHLGCKKENTNISLHRHDFDLDETCIKTGILIQTSLVLNKLLQ